MKNVHYYDVLTATLVNDSYGLSKGSTVKLRYSGITQVEVLSNTPFNYSFDMVSKDDVSTLFNNLKFSHTDVFETIN